MDKVASNLTKIVSRTTSSSATKALTLEAATLARFSDGACTCSLGDTTVLVTAVSHPPQKAAGSFVPLTVDYRQKAAAAGRIPMTHLRRDIGVTERETLISRMIDRSIRPAFVKGFCNDTQIICNLLAVDGSNDADIPAINGASASLTLSDIPWNGPIGAVRMGLIGENVVINPSRKEQDNSRLNLVIAANSIGNVVMIDGACKEPLLMPDVQKAIKAGVKECQAVIESIIKLQSVNGKPKREIDLSHLPTEEHLGTMTSLAETRLKEILTNYEYDKISRDEAMKGLREEVCEVMREKFPEAGGNIFADAFSTIVRNTYRQVLVDTNIRCDGRKLNEMRPISCSVNLYKPLHGSALFQRGQSQVFCSTTFDSPDAAFRTDSITSLVSGVKEKNFMLHYEFPPYATNEIGRVATMPGRREIGHGALAEKGIRPIVPENQDMTIRLNCEVFESNGSTSMASVSAGSLSLMDAGVNIKEHVAGVAMGLIGSDFEDSKNSRASSDQNSKTSATNPEPYLLTDISGFEDYIGDMDFKIAGTRRAITALQLDVKPMKGVSTSIVYKALQEAHKARSEIINKMDKAIREPRKEKKDNHPVIKAVYIPPHKMAKFIGFGGSNLKKLMAQIGVRVSPSSGASVSANDVSSDSTESNGSSDMRGNFVIFAPNKEALEEALEYIKTCIEEQREPELDFNGIYTATIHEIRPNGVMVTLYTNMMPALLPLSQLDIKTVTHPSALNFEVGQQIQVKYFGRDPATGQMRLSRKSLLMSSVPRVRQPKE